MNSYDEVDPLFKGTVAEDTVVGYLDLLGTSAEMFRGGLQSVLRIYERQYFAINSAQLFFGATGIHPKQHVRYFMFSDSIVFLAKAADPVSVTRGYPKT